MKASCSAAAPVDSDASSQVLTSKQLNLNCEQVPPNFRSLTLTLIW